MSPFNLFFFIFPLAHAYDNGQLSRLAGYAHLDLDGVNVDRESLQRDLGAIINCMTLLQVCLLLLSL